MLSCLFVSIFKLNEDKTKVKRKTPIQELKDLDEKTVYVVSNTCINGTENQIHPPPQKKNPHKQINAQIP